MTTFGAIATNSAGPGGELGGDWATPTVDTIHSGSAHTDFLDKDGWTANRVIFADGSGNLTTDAGLTYDASTDVLTVDSEVRVVDGATRYATISTQLANYGYFHGGIASPSSTNFALAQGPLGTFVNAETGTTLFFQIANGSICTIGTGGLTFANAKDIIVNTSTGTKIATATGQKLGFWNATPVVQQANTVGIDALLTTVGFRASGGTSAPFASKIYPPTDAGALQTAAGIYAGTGAPNNANGANGDFYFNSAGGALTTVYQKRVGVWVGLV